MNAYDRNLINPLEGFGTLLRVLDRWADREGYLVYKAEDDGAGGLKKFPVDPETGLMTAPNKTEDRAVLTLVEAIDAATTLIERGQGFYGVGMATERVGVLAVDLDACVVGGMLAPETLKLIGGTLESYAEISPSGGGARMLIDGLPDFAKDMATGSEVCGVGLYYTTRKFVTLTGIPLVGSPDEVCAANHTVAQIASHIAKHRTAEVLDEWYGDRDISIEAAEKMILEGSSLHPATMAWLTRAWNKIHWTEQEVEDRLYDLYDRSAARGATPARWGQRRQGIKRQLDWVRRTFGRRARKIEDLPTQVVETAYRHVREWKARQQEAANDNCEVVVEDDDFDPDVIEGDGPWRLENPLYGSFDLTRDEVLALQATLMKPWQSCANKEGFELVGYLRTADINDERDAARAAHGQVEDVDHRWMLDMPSAHGKRLANYLHQAQTFDMPGVATLGALIALAGLCANRYYVEGWRLTGLQLYGAATARSAAGKQASLDLLQAAAEAVESTCIGRSASGPALYRTVAEGPAVMQIDEWAKMLTAMVSKGNSHGAELARAILELWGKGLGVLPKQVYAQAKSDVAASAFPSLSVLAVTTSEGLNEALDPSMATDGQMNRFLLIDAGKRKPPRWPVGHKYPDLWPVIEDVAPSFAVGAFTARPAVQKRAFRHRVDGEAVDRSLVRITLPDGSEAKVREELAQLEQGLGTLADLAGRFEYNVIVIAGLLCAGDYVHGIDDPAEPLVITDAQFDYAIKLARQSVLDMGARFGRDVAHSDTDRLMIKAKEYLVKAIDGPRDKRTEGRAEWLDSGLIPSSVLTDAMRGVPATHRKAMIIAMIEAEWLEELDPRDHATGKKGRVPMALWRALPSLWE